METPQPYHDHHPRIDAYGLMANDHYHFINKIDLHLVLLPDGNDINFNKMDTELIFKTIMACISLDAPVVINSLRKHKDL